MTRPDAASSPEAYSPRRRTALLLSGTGTDGAYHAGVLRALHESGVSIDVVAARGIGVIAALFAAVDGVQRLCDEKGFWRAGAVRRFYGWHSVIRLLGGSLLLSVGIVAVPVLAAGAGLIVLPIDFVLKLIGVGAVDGLASLYLQLLALLVAPSALPTWLPRLVFLTLGAAALTALLAGWLDAGPRRLRGPFWWRMVPVLLSAGEVVDRTWRALWEMVRGAARLKHPQALDLARRYTELLTENLGQPGFRELLIAVHDVDAGRDQLFALVAEPRRRSLTRRSTSSEAEARLAEIRDLAGIERDHLQDAVSAALTLPLASGYHQIQFSAESYWRGETHRLCDRPSCLPRLIEELVRLDVDQIIVASAAPEARGPHALSRPRIDARGRLGEYLRSCEAAVVSDAAGSPPSGVRMFVIRPVHNPVGPLDFSGGFDDRSDRRFGLAELMSRGYEDAYRQFIEPVVGASGDRMGVG